MKSETIDQSTVEASQTAGSSVADRPRGLLKSEDWWAVWLGATILLIALGASWLSRTADYTNHLVQIEQLTEQLQTVQQEADQATGAMASALAAQAEQLEQQIESLTGELHRNPLKPWLAKPTGWTANPTHGFLKKGVESWEALSGSSGPIRGLMDSTVVLGVLGAFVFSLLLFGLGVRQMGKSSFVRFIPAFSVVFLLATFAELLAGQTVINYYNLEYALWALLVGLLISNTIGTPAWLRPGAQTEFYIKTGLVLLGAEVLLTRLLVLGVPGIFVSWVVTPVVLVSTYLFGQYLLKISSKSLNMVISADMSVCGVSAAIATAAACKAKKEELSLAIGISLCFTVIMMIVMPAVIRAVGMNDVLGGAWLGGTIDSTGAVAAAGGFLSDTALEVAATIKMIQNILIGVVAFCVAIYWVMYVERSESARPSAMEIWYRFPKFVIGFVAASLLFSLLYSTGPSGASLAETAVSGTSKTLRGWFFCLAFVSIGLETNFRELGQYLKGGKPLVLYVCGQALNLCLTLLMAWLMFEVVFPQATELLAK